ncbi:MAG: DciA family protein [Gammaproteobacteria bacterium]
MENFQLEINNKTFKSVRAYATTALAVQLHKHQALLAIVRGALPAKLAVHAADCVLSERKLLVYTDSANWASQLRFHNGVILAAVNAAGEAIEVVVTRIQPPVEKSRAITHHAQLPSAKHIEIIRDAAHNIADERLKAALERLGATLKRLYDAARP